MPVALGLLVLEDMTVFSRQSPSAGSRLAWLSMFLTAAFLISDVSRALASGPGLVLTMGGDTSFSNNLNNPVNGLSGEKGVPGSGGKITPFEYFSTGIRSLVDGDLNFLNIETVVSDRPDLKSEEKKFVFQMHPNGMRHLIDLGFNLFSIANNHAYDKGIQGLMETRGHLEKLQTESAKPMYYHGGGRNRAEAARPLLIKRNDYTIAFLAIGIIEPRFAAGENKPGLVDIRSEGDYTLVLRNMKAVQADLKVLSVHYGTEKQVTLDKGQRERYYRALGEGDVDLVIGHHPHVVRPIEMVAGRIIVYSLGNFMMLGAASLNDRTDGFDFGLFGRVYYGWSQEKQRLRAQAMEVVPLKQMHFRPRPVEAILSQQKNDALNTLSRAEVAERAVTFLTRADGTGYACGHPSTIWTARAARICARVDTPMVSR